jgi:hypothetical protein
MFIFTALLFFVLTPGIVLSLPPKGSKLTVAAVHAVVFALIFTFTHKLVWDWGVSSGLIVKDAFTGGNAAMMPAAPKTA